jgi:hypothetical protein
MRRKMIPVEASLAAWRKDPEYEKAYNALEEEFTLAAAMIEARARAGLSRSSSWPNGCTRPRRSSPASKAAG